MKGAYFHGRGVLYAMKHLSECISLWIYRGISKGLFIYFLWQYVKLGTGH